jgi:polyhydroxybutyrate depolymerase
MATFMDTNGRLNYSYVTRLIGVIGYLFLPQACGTDTPVNAAAIGTAGITSTVGITGTAGRGSVDAGVKDRNVTDGRIAEVSAVDSGVANSPAADATIAPIADASVEDSHMTDASVVADTGVADGSAVTLDSAADAVDDASIPKDCPAKSLSAGEHTFTIESANGITYKYYLVVPKSYKPNIPTPVVVVWHALSSDPDEARSVINLDENGEKNGVINVFPESADKLWDVGSCCRDQATMFDAVNAARDELVFAKELVADVESKVCVDRKRIYTHGFSNGGMMSQMLACKAADIFAAAAPTASTLTIPQDECKPTRPISIFMINGTADALVGYDATAFAEGITVPETFKMWSTLNKCTGEPVETLNKGQATCETYNKCAAGVVVTMCTVQDMGHCLPGMKTESDTSCGTRNANLLTILPIDIQLGAPNNDIDGIQMTYDFLLKYAMP